MSVGVRQNASSSTLRMARSQSWPTAWTSTYVRRLKCDQVRCVTKCAVHRPLTHTADGLHSPALNLVHSPALNLVPDPCLLTKT